MNSAARTDLLESTRASDLTRAQYRSFTRLAIFPDELALWPTHGAGSFCSAPPGSQRMSTIGAERQNTLLLAVTDIEGFVKAFIASRGSYPSYFVNLAADNHLGPTVVTETPPIPAITTDELKSIMAHGAQTIDIRPAADYSAGHIPGAIRIPLSRAVCDLVRLATSRSCTASVHCKSGPRPRRSGVADPQDRLWTFSRLPSGWNGCLGPQDTEFSRQTSLPLVRRMVGRLLMSARKLNTSSATSLVRHTWNLATLLT